MNGNARPYVANFLLGLNVFVLFLLIFEGELAIPRWLQPVGRMHPLMLHFPIVLLLLAMAMEFFRFKESYRHNPFYKRFVSGLLLAGVITSGLAVVMGIFLSQEEGYAPTALALHKWTGAAVFFIASTLYAWRNRKSYRAPLAKTGAVLVAVAIIAAGHFGGALTHGDNFILQPVLANAPKHVPIDEAIVFEHVIKPVLEEKCISCHNARKLKGELMLTDSASIIRGGKTGGLVVAGDAGRSLLMRRVLLPESEKKHMPPSGKTQLTAAEKALLYHWIQSGAEFSRPLVAHAPSDSLRIVATKFLQPDKPTEVFTFPPVASRVLERLNSNYRVIRPVAINSPALTVNIYNRETYAPSTLDELREVKTQIISLDLGKMPVRDEDLKYVTRLENLRELNLNFTEITGQALKFLSEMDHLTDLSLAGTKVTFADLRQYVPLFKSLKTLAIWDTDVAPEDLETLQQAFGHIAILGGVKWNERPLIKLNRPTLKNKTLVFKDTIALELAHPVQGVDIRFTLDGTEPDSVGSALFSGHTVLKKTTTINARAYKDGWLSSDPAVLHVYQSKYKPDSAVLLSDLNRVHKANGVHTFFDYQLGSFNANSPAWANNWAGSFNKNLEVLVRFNTPKPVSSVGVNTLIETENLIFPPAAIEVWGGPSEEGLRLIHRCQYPLPTTYSKPFIKLFQCEFETQHISVMKVIAKPVMALPAWHKRKHRPALLLIDEMLIN